MCLLIQQPRIYTPQHTHTHTVHRTNIFCDKYDSSQKTYCKRLRVLCPEHTKEPKVYCMHFILFGWIFISLLSFSIFLIRSVLMMSVVVPLILTSQQKYKLPRSSVVSQRSLVCFTTAGRSFVGQKLTKKNSTWSAHEIMNTLGYLPSFLCCMLKYCVQSWLEPGPWE